MFLTMIQMIKAMKKVSIFAEAVKDAKIKWLEKKVETLEKYRIDPESGWAAIQDISSMFGGHIKSNTHIKMKEQGG